MPNPPRSGTAPTGRVPPHNLEAERALLGAMLLSRDAIAAARVTLTDPGDLYQPRHAHIYEAACRLNDRGEAVDPITVAADLTARDLLDQAGGRDELITLQANAPGTANAGHYARIIHDHARLRRLIGAANTIAEGAYALPDDVDTYTLHAEQILGEVAAATATGASSLRIVDMGALLAGDIEPIAADFLERSDGMRLLYAGRMHILRGEPESGKTWIALQAAVEVMALGATVLYLDYEDSPKGIVGRLLELGADPSRIPAQFAYVGQDGPFGPAERLELDTLVAQLAPELVIIDGIAEALVRDGLDEDKAGQFTGWIERVPRPLARTGAAVVMLDHVVKDQAGRGRWGRGTGAKLGVVDGAQYELRVQVRFSKHQAGKVRLVVDKDRPGNHTTGDTVAVAHITPSAAGAVVRIQLTIPEAVVPGTHKPTIVMGMVSRFLTQHGVPTSSQAIVEGLGTQRAGIVRQAIQALITDKYLRETHKGNVRLLILERSYSHDDEPEPAELDEPPPGLFDDSAPAGPHPRPRSSQHRPGRHR